MFVGFSGYTAGVGYNTGVGSDTDFYNNNGAFGLKLENNETNFECYHNNGTTPGTTEVTPIAPADTQIHTFEIRAINSIPRFQYKIDNAVSWVDVDTDLPLDVMDLGFQCWIKNNVASSKTWRLVDIYTRMDNKG